MPFHPRTCRQVHPVHRSLPQPLGPGADFQPGSQQSADPPLSGPSLSCASTRLRSPTGPIKLSAEVPPPRERPRRAAANHLLPGSAERRLDPDLRVPFPQALTSRRSRAQSEVGYFGLSPPNSARFECPASAPAPARAAGSGAPPGAFRDLPFHPRTPTSMVTSFFLPTHSSTGLAFLSVSGSVLAPACLFS